MTPVLGNRERFSMSDIAEWWPQLHIELRRVLVNGIWSPVSPYAQSEIARLGGPAPDSAYWKRSDGEVYLPKDAVLWIIESPDFNALSTPREPDPRAAYFRRGWPRRQP